MAARKSTKRTSKPAPQVMEGGGASAVPIEDQCTVEGCELRMEPKTGGRCRIHADVEPAKPDEHRASKAATVDEVRQLMVDDDGNALPVPRVQGGALVVSPEQYDVLREAAVERASAEPTGYVPEAVRVEREREWRRETLTGIGLPAEQLDDAPDQLIVVVQTESGDVRATS